MFDRHYFACVTKKNDAYIYLSVYYYSFRLFTKYP